MKHATIVPVLKFEARALPFKIQTINQLPGEQEDTNAAPHSHDYYEMIWITNGRGTLHADLYEYTIDKDMLYCVRPGQVHQLQTCKDTEGFVLSFTESFLKLADHEFDPTCQAGLFQLFSGSWSISIPKEIIADINEIVVKMTEEFDNHYSFRDQLLSRYFKIFLIYLNRQIEEAPEAVGQTRETELVKSFLELLEKNYKEKKMVAEYAAELSVTPNYLNGIVKKITGFPASYHIRQRVVLEAKRLGRYSDAGMKEIAYSLGFSDSCHFSKFFKSFSGMNFSDFRKEGLRYALYSEQCLTA